MTTIFFFRKSDLRAEIACASSPLNGCLVSISWETVRGAGRMDFCDFTTRRDFSEGSCLQIGSLFLAVLRFDMVEDFL